MELWILRHGIAEEGEGEQADDARALTRKGRSRVERTVDGLAHLGAGFDRVVHSPLLRAVQTAEMLLPLVEGESAVTELLTQPPSEALLTLLAGERVAVVGHQPWLGQLVSLLVVGTVEKGDRFEVKKAGAIHLRGEVAPGGMTIVGVYPPRLLRALA